MLHPQISHYQRWLTLANTAKAARTTVMHAHVHTGPPPAGGLNDPALLCTGAFVGGEWISPSNTFDVINPATAKCIASVSDCGVEETEMAIKAAHEAFPTWAGRPAKERASIMHAWAALVRDARDDITKLMTLECGKPLAESRSEFDSGIESIDWFAEECKRSTGDVLESPSRDKRFMVLRQPVGVAAAITPWNFPFSMITRKTSPAIAAGCPVVLKPSELTPLTALALAELARRAGVPRGVLNVLPTAHAAVLGDTVMASPLVRKISFTGSTAVGKKLAAAAAGTVKRVSLELGGNAPFIIFKDANVEKAAREVALSSYRNAGQTCICTNRVFVDDSIHDEFVTALVARVKALKVGDGLVPGTTHGPLISATAVDRVELKVEEAQTAGARVMVGGGRSIDGTVRDGYFYQPTVLTEVKEDMRIFSEEIFGPVTPVTRFTSEEEALRGANATPYGLAAYFFTNDLKRAWRAAEALQYGMVGVNTAAITSEVAPFGGIKESGMGREQSKYGLAEYQDLKTVCLAL